ncbi:MAG TPA: hypothetical protein VF830_01140, partial [Gemmatimonadales bacterium]
LSAFGTSVVTAIAGPRALGRMNLAGWAIIAGSMPAIALGARWGLVGVVYAVALAWAAQGAIAFMLGIPALRSQPAADVPVVEPNPRGGLGRTAPAPEA